MPPPSNKRGYIINAMRKKQKLSHAGETTKRKGEPVQEHQKKPREGPESDVASDDPEPVVSDFESSQPQQENQELSPSQTDAQMDTHDINAGTPGAASNAGGAGEDQPHSRSARSTGGGGKGMSGSAGGGLRGTAILPRGVRQDTMSSVRTYRKQYLFRLQNEVIETAHRYVEVFKLATNGQYSKIYPNNYGSVGVIRYPYHDLPVNMLGFYLCEEEMHALQYFSEARVLSVQCDVYNKTGVLNFETASSTSNIGNNNIGIYLNQISSDVGRKRTGQLPDIVPFIEDVCWGKTHKVQRQDSEFTSTDVAQLGARYVRRTLSNKFEYMTPMNQSMQQDLNANTYAATNQTFTNNVPGIIPYFNINPFIEKRINASMDEGLFASYSYKPINGLVAGNFSVGPTTFFTSILGMNNKVKLPMQKPAQTTTTDNRNALGLFNALGDDNTLSTPDANALNLIPYVRAADVTTLIDREDITGKKIPPFIIGIEPLLSEIPTNTSNRWEAVKCFVDLYVDVELQMEAKFGYDYIDPSIPSIPPNYKFPQYMTLGSANKIITPHPMLSDLLADAIPTMNVDRREFQNVPILGGYPNPLGRRTENIAARSISSFNTAPVTRAKAKAAKAASAEEESEEIKKLKAATYWSERRSRELTEALKTKFPSEKLFKDIV